MTNPADTTDTAVVLHGDADTTRSIAAFASSSNFDAAQRMAKALAASSIVPKEYQGNIANCLVAMEIAGRTGAGIMMVMQNLYVIQGRPSWSAIFLIGSVNSCGRFSPLRYEIQGGDDPSAMTYRVRAVATELATGDHLTGEWITWGMVNGEGWLSKAGSKWKTMPGQMFRYRAASFWTRTYAPEISLGMLTTEEASDIPPARGATSSGVDTLNRALLAAPIPVATETVTADGVVIEGETEAQRAERLAFDAKLAAKEGK